MKTGKKCHRTMTGDNFEPTNCIREQCSAWMGTSEISGCSFVLNAIMSTVKYMTDMVEQEKEKNENPNDGKSEPQGGKGRSNGTPKDGPQDDPSRTIREDTKEVTEGNTKKHVEPNHSNKHTKVKS